MNILITVSLSSVNMPQIFWSTFQEAEFLGHKVCFYSAITFELLLFSNVLLHMNFTAHPK